MQFRWQERKRVKKAWAGAIAVQGVYGKEHNAVQEANNTILYVIFCD